MNRVPRRYRIKNFTIYKEIKKIFNELFGYPSYRDNIIHGVSFKWYLRSEIINRWGNEKIIKDVVKDFLKNNLEPTHNVNFEVKVLRHPFRTGGPHSFRILMRI